MDVAPHAVAIQDLAEQDRAPIAELRNEVGELMSGIGHSDRLGARRDDVAGENRRQFVRTQRCGPKSKLLPKRVIELNQTRRCDWGGVNSSEEAPGQARVAVGERDRIACATNGRASLL